MRKISVAALAVVLCTLAAVCRSDKPDPDSGKRWARTIEPRLSDVTEWQPCRAVDTSEDELVPRVQCGAGRPVSRPPVSTSDEECQKMLMTTLTDANRILSTHPHCADRVIRILEEHRQTGASAKNDLAAAYYVRAQLNRDTVDYLRAYEAAEDAVTKNPRLAAAQFNLALVQEALALYEQAIESLDRFRSLEPDDSPWDDEARQRRNRLQRVVSVDVSVEWPLVKKELATLAAQRNSTAVRKLIRPYTTLAQQYIEDELLPPGSLDAAELIAQEIKGVTHDKYIVDVVRALRNASPQQRRSYQKGHELLSAARRQERSLEPSEARRRFQAAAQWLPAGGPARQVADVKAAAYGSDLEQLERLTANTTYPFVRALAYFQRGGLLHRQNRLVESLNAYNAAVAASRDARDLELEVGTYARKIGVLRTVGQSALAWNDSIWAQRRRLRIGNIIHHTVMVSEAADTAMILGYPEVALRYRDAYVAERRSQLLTSATDLALNEEVVRHLALALRGRARVHVKLGNRPHAERDLAEAERLLEKRLPGDHEARAMLQMQTIEVQAQSALRSEPAIAVARFTDALTLMPPNVYRTYRASLLVQRAEANRLADRRALSEADLVAALDELRKEESEILARRKPGENEAVWSSYFARFRATYERLAREYVAAGRFDDAFRYTERARAFEPLSLILQAGPVAEAFAAVAKSGEPLDRTAIQRRLPAGTFVVEYFSLDDETLVWVVSRDHFQVKVLPVTRHDIAGWTSSLQEAAARGDDTTFGERLYAPYAALLSAPLAMIAQRPGGRDAERRIVFVPDGPIHGLPLVALRNSGDQRHLIEDAIVEIAASATLYVHSLERDAQLAKHGAPSALLVGNPSFDRTLELARDLKPLPYAEGEVQSIRGHYEPRVDVLTGDDATVPQFLALARRHSVVHVAAHGIPNPQAPFQSMLLFAPSTGHTGVLTAEELVGGLKLDRTRLVILAACSSAGGSPVGPEGLAPLVRPLFAARVPGVIGSLWSVRDDEASQLLVRFHEHYRLGKDAATALRDAQLDLLRGERRTSVLAWAPFQAIGHASSPFGPANQKQK